jgi:large subunit ribosomal protein L25
VNLPGDATPTITDRDFTIATLQSPGGGVKNLDEEDEEAGEEASGEDGESTE